MERRTDQPSPIANMWHVAQGCVAPNRVFAAPRALDDMHQDQAWLDHEIDLIGWQDRRRNVFPGDTGT